MICVTTVSSSSFLFFTFFPFSFFPAAGHKCSPLLSFAHLIPTSSLLPPMDPDRWVARIDQVETSTRSARSPSPRMTTRHPPTLRPTSRRISPLAAPITTCRCRRPRAVAIIPQWARRRLRFSATKLPSPHSAIAAFPFTGGRATDSFGSWLACSRAWGVVVFHHLFSSFLSSFAILEVPGCNCITHRPFSPLSHPFIDSFPS